MRLSGGDAEARFRRAGSRLARLQHPNIASAIEADVSESGQPYLILEYVHGERIDAYCDGKRLSIEARLQLFLQVLAAVAHAHAHLILHRHLKPSNVLVGPNATIKVLDVGVASLVVHDSATPMPSPVRVPEYAAPEQLTGAAVTTATDVYSLGALLYVLLTGQHPARVYTNSPAELLRAIVQDVPLPASEAVVSGRATRAETAADTAVKRATQPKRLQRQLQGDLDAIVATALKKSPADRYGSVDALADDLRRYLGHTTVRARAATVGYRTEKFARRHRWTVAAGVVTVAGLATGLFVANRERAVAQRRFVQVRQLANRLFDIDGQIRELPGNAPARQLIVQTTLDYLQRLAADAGEDPELALEVGTAYMQVARAQGVPTAANLGRPEQAEQSLRLAEQFIQSVLFAQSDNRSALLRMAQINHDRMLLAGLRRPDDGALPLAGTAATWLNKYLDHGTVVPGDAEQVVVTLNDVGDRYRIDEQFDQALSLTRRGIDIASSADDPAVKARLGDLLLSRSRIYRDQGALDQAVQDLRAAVTALEAQGSGDRRPRPYASALLELGLVLGADDGVSLGRPAEGVPYLQRAFDIADEQTHKNPADIENRQLLATAGYHLARLLKSQDAQRSLDVFDHVLKHVGEGGDDVRLRRGEVRALAGSTLALHSLGNEAEAHRRLESAFKRLADMKLYPSDHVDVGSEADVALRARAESEAAAGNPGQAADTYRQLLDHIMTGKPSGEDSLAAATDLSRLYSSLASLYHLSGRPDLASPLETQRLELWNHWNRKLTNNAFVLQQLSRAR
jgi:tetratricopeptide (TPR) repeat protein